MRSFISRAALLVKVTARICEPRARPVHRMWAMRVVSTRVLPVPAPASTSTGLERLDGGALLGVEVRHVRRRGHAQAHARKSDLSAQRAPPERGKSAADLWRFAGISLHL